METKAGQTHEFGPFCLDPAERKLLREGAPVALTPKCFDLLVILVENGGHLLEKQELLNRLWPNQFVEEGNLSFNISALRKALGEGKNGERYIETVSKKGFRFVAPVAEHQKPAPSSIIVDESRMGYPNGLRQSLSLRIAVGVLAVGILALLVYGLSRRFGVTPADQPLKTIAVLPFKPLSTDSRDESLEMGMAETMITRLSNIKQIVVRPMSAVRKYTDLQQDPVKAGQELQTDAILDGSIQKVGDRVRVTVRLTNVRTGASLWAEQFDANFTDIFKMQDSISARVAEALPLKLSGEEKERVGKHHTNSPEAYELYIQAEYLWNNRTDENRRKSIEYYEQAIEKDPKFALAYIGLAELEMTAIGANKTSVKETGPKILANLTKALELDDKLAEAHNLLAEIKYQFEFDWPGAESEFKKAIELNANVASIHLAYGWYLMSAARFDEALREMERARELDPHSLIINRAKGGLFYFTRQYDRAIQHYQRILDAGPNLAVNHWAIARTYARKGMYAEAVDEFAKAAMIDGALSPAEIEGDREAFRVSGWQAYWLRRNDRMLRRPKDVYVSSLSIAVHYVTLGNKDQAFAWLDKAVDARASGVLQLKIDPMFDDLRSDPRFAKLLRRMNINP